MSTMKHFLVAHYSLHTGELIQEFVVASSPYSALVTYIKPSDIDYFCKSYEDLDSILNDYAPNCDTWYSVADLDSRNVYN